MFSGDAIMGNAQQVSNDEDGISALLFPGLNVPPDADQSKARLPAG